MSRLRLGITTTVVLLAAAGLTLDLFDIGRASSWFGEHQFASALLAEMLFLGGTYLIVEQVAYERDRKRWRQATSRPLSDLYQAANHLIQLALAELLDLLANSQPADDLVLERFAKWSAQVERSQPLLTATADLVPLYQQVDEMNLGYSLLGEHRLKAVIEAHEGAELREQGVYWALLLGSCGRLDNFESAIAEWDPDPRLHEARRSGIRGIRKTLSLVRATIDVLKKIAPGTRVQMRDLGEQWIAGTVTGPAQPEEVGPLESTHPEDIKVVVKWDEALRGSDTVALRELEVLEDDAP